MMISNNSASAPLEIRPNRNLALFGFVALCLGVSALGGAATSTGVSTWYQELNQPSFTPPDWVFAPVWMGLYLLMAIAGWRVWRLPDSRTRQTALTLFAVQLGFNLAWSVLFFGFHQIGLALIDILVLLAAIAANTALFWRLDWIAGTFFTPYLAWVAYASVLNGAFWLIN